jgi:hypothetical protein
VSTDLELCVGKWVLERIPFLFSDDAAAYGLWRHRLAAGLGVDPCDLVVTGSASAGFSLSPHKGLKLFDGNSDIDVAVVSPHHFDVAWRCLRGLGATLYSFTPSERSSVESHKRRLVYWGTVATDRLLPRFPFGREWLSVLSEMTGCEPANGRQINVRLYRDFQALRAYQADGFRKLREAGFD